MDKKNNLVFICVCIFSNNMAFRLWELKQLCKIKDSVHQFVGWFVGWTVECFMEENITLLRKA